MSTINFADVAHPYISFSQEIDYQKLVLELLDTRWVQRLRQIAQTGNTSLVYMFSEHSRFGHSLGVAYLASTLISSLLSSSSQEQRKQVEEYACAVCAAALLHDIGHIAPGSHTAYKTWFAAAADTHEEIALNIIKSDQQIQKILNSYSPDLSQKVCAILCEADSVPAWTWQTISGAGWNVDRGNWCLVDSAMAGVSYGKYNVQALIDSIIITQDGNLAVTENRLDAVSHFAVARHSMYRQVYQHRVLLAADMLNKVVADRARDLGDKLEFADAVMQKVLKANSSLELDLNAIYQMTESWWRYHLMQWVNSHDKTLSDLAQRLVERRLFKTVRLQKAQDPKDLVQQTTTILKQLGFDPKYYLSQVTSSNMHAGDSQNPMLVQMDDGRLSALNEVDPLVYAMLSENENSKRSWLVMPKEAKQLLGKNR